MILLRGGSGPAFYIRDAAGENITLGRRLSSDLRGFLAKLASAGDDLVAAEIPAVYSEALRRTGDDPRAAWIDQRLTDIILNRGNSTLWPLIHAMEAQDRRQSN